VQEFSASGTFTFTVPRHVTHVMLTMWGAGGGGGGGTENPGTFSCFPGGFGGGGAYTNTVVPVFPGETYNVTVGQGGSGANPGENGGDGGNSQLTLGNKILAFAGGGKGGGVATQSGSGSDGSGGQADGTAQISHPATSDYPYANNLIPNPDARGQVVFGHSGIAAGGLRGQHCSGEVVINGWDGGPGYVLLTF